MLPCCKLNSSYQQGHIHIRFHSCLFPFNGYLDWPLSASTVETQRSSPFWPVHLPPSATAIAGGFGGVESALLEQPQSRRRILADELPRSDLNHQRSIVAAVRPGLRLLFSHCVGPRLSSTAVSASKLNFSSATVCSTILGTLPIRWVSFL